MLALLVAAAVGGPADEHPKIDAAAQQITEAARSALEDSVSSSTQRIVDAIRGRPVTPQPVAQQPTTKPSGVVQLSKLPSKPGHGVGIVHSGTPGGWVVFKTTIAGFSFVESMLIDGNPQDGYRVVAFEELPGTYGVLFLEKGITQPRVINVTIGGVAPTPTPTPTPTPNPTPDPKPTPNERFGLATYAKNLLSMLTQQERNRQVSVVMPDGNTSQTTAAQAVGAVYYDIAGRIETNEIKQIDDIGPALSKSTRAVLEQGTGAGRWPDVVIIPLGARANQLYTDGKIRNLDDWAAALVEIYKGF